MAEGGGGGAAAAAATVGASGPSQMSGFSVTVSSVQSKSSNAGTAVAVRQVRDLDLRMRGLSL